MTCHEQCSGAFERVSARLDRLEGCTLTKREAFAMAAMQGFAANSFAGDRMKPIPEYTIAELANISVSMADALLAELAKENEK